MHPRCWFDNPLVANSCDREHNNGYFLQHLHRIVWIGHRIPGRLMLRKHPLLDILADLKEIFGGCLHFAGKIIQERGCICDCNDS